MIPAPGVTTLYKRPIGRLSLGKYSFNTARALTAAAGFNPLNRQTGVLSWCWPSVLGWVAITSSHNAKCNCWYRLTSYSCVPVCQHQCTGFFRSSHYRAGDFIRAWCDWAEAGALSAACRFNPLNRQTGILVWYWPSVLGGVRFANTYSHDTKCACWYRLKSHYCIPVCRHRCMGDFRRSQEHMGDYIRESSMPEQHLKALSAAVRFNPLNRQTGVLSSCRPSVLSWVAITCSHHAKCTCWYKLTSYSCMPVCRHQCSGYFRS